MLLSGGTVCLTLNSVVSLLASNTTRPSCPVYLQSDDTRARRYTRLHLRRELAAGPRGEAVGAAEGREASQNSTHQLRT